MKLIAHRGLWSKDVKDNSYEALKNGLESNKYIGIECDIRTTLDNKFIIYHNSLYNGALVRNTYFKELLKYTRELKVLNIFKMYFLLCNKDLTKQIRTHGLLLKCKKTLDIKSKICGRSRYRRFLEVARAAL